MSERIGFAESVWKCLKDVFGATAACGSAVAEAMGVEPNKVATALNALADRNAVIDAGRDEQGRKLYKAKLNAKFRRPRAGDDAPPPNGKRRPKKKPARRTAVAPRPTIAEDAPQLEPASQFAVDGTWHILIRDGASSVRIAPSVALAMRDFIDQLAPALEAAQ